MTAQCTVCRTKMKILWPALLTMIAALHLPSLSPVAKAFSPEFRGRSRNRRSKNLASFSGTTLAPDVVLRDKEIADDSETRTRLSTSSTRSQSGVEVWDGVFSPEVCRELHELAVDHSERTTREDFEDDGDDEDDSLDGSSIFFHKGHNRSPDDKLTPIEQALDSFLTAYYDLSDEQHRNRQIVVEYWCRQEHLNLEAHADVDEVWFERSCEKLQKAAGNHPSVPFRYPAIGHVLYLTKPTLGVGPTCVFPPKAGMSTDSVRNQQTGDDSIRGEIDSVVTVPAVPGRVLRFPGRALHAVPKPADVWFSKHDIGDTQEEDMNEEEKGNNDDDDNCQINYEWEDDDDDDDDEERSVILFNTWEVDGAEDDAGDSPIGPIGVRLDPMFHVDSDIGIVEMMMSSVDMDGVEVNEDFVNGMVQYARQQRNQQLQEWQKKYCLNIGEELKGDGDETKRAIVYSRVHCEPRDSWKLASIDTNPNDPERHEDDSGGDKGTIRVPLMGDKLRRRYPDKTVRWTVPSSFEKGVNEHTRPCEFPLTT